MVLRRDQVSEILKARQLLPGEILARHHYDVKYQTNESTPTTFNADVDSTELFTIKDRVYGLGMHGYLPPGAVAFVVPLKEASMLADMTSSSSVERRSKLLQIALGSVSGYTKPQLRPGVVVMGAGDVVMFDKPFEDGIAIWCMTAWCGTSENPPYMRMAAAQYDQTGQEQADTEESIFLQHTPVPTPLFRVYTAPVAQPASLTWIPVPLTMLVQNISTDAPNTNPDEPIYFVGGGATHVTINFLDDADNTVPTPIVAGESGVYEVWWFTTAGVWVHNGADDWDDDGRGRVSSVTGVLGEEHSYEVYEIPHNAVAIGLRKISATGSGFIAVLAVTQQHQTR